MSKIKNLLLTKVNAFIGSLIALLGIGVATSTTSCDNQVVEYIDTIHIDTMVHVMYGVGPIEFEFEETEMD